MVALQHSDFAGSSSIFNNLAMKLASGPESSGVAACPPDDLLARSRLQLSLVADGAHTQAETSGVSPKRGYGYGDSSQGYPGMGISKNEVCRDGCNPHLRFQN